jgi:large subunit ribosomal protein L28
MIRVEYEPMLGDMNMAGKRKITQVTPQFGNNRSHSMKATRRQFKPNIQSKRIWIPEAGRFVRVQVTAHELKVIDKIGLDAFMKRQGRSIKSLL